MKYLILLFFVCSMRLVNAQSIYEMDVNSIESKFSNINKAEVLIQQDPSSKELKQLLRYHNQNDSSKSFAFEDIDFKYFALGACCWQYGAIYLIAKKNVTREEKVSFCMGASTNLLVLLTGIIIDSGLIDNFSNISIF